MTDGANTSQLQKYLVEGAIKQFVNDNDPTSRYIHRMHVLTVGIMVETKYRAVSSDTRIVRVVLWIELLDAKYNPLIQVMKNNEEAMERHYG